MPEMKRFMCFSSSFVRDFVKNIARIANRNSYQIRMFHIGSISGGRGVHICRKGGPYLLEGGPYLLEGGPYLLEGGSISAGRRSISAGRGVHICRKGVPICWKGGPYLPEGGSISAVTPAGPDEWKATYVTSN